MLDVDLDRLARDEALSPPASPDHAFSTWAAEFDGMYRFGRMFMLTMHPQITGRPSRLTVLERLIRHMKTRSNVAFLRAVDLAEYWIQTYGTESPS